jgi:hypothetical protein
MDRGPIPWRSIHLYAERYGLVMTNSIVSRADPRDGRGLSRYFRDRQT